MYIELVHMNANLVNNNSGKWVFGGANGKGLIIKADAITFWVCVDGKKPVAKRNLVLAQRHAKKATDYTVLVDADYTA